MTEAQRAISSKNKAKAREYFGISGDKNLILHHIDMSLRHNDIERYIQWNPEDLIVMTNSEHTKYHAQFRTEETNRKISETLKKKFSDGTIKSWNKGRTGVYSEETLEKLSHSAKAKNTWSKGVSKPEETRKKMSEAAKRRWARYRDAKNTILQ